MDMCFHQEALHSPESIDLLNFITVFFLDRKCYATSLALPPPHQHHLPRNSAWSLLVSAQSALNWLDWYLMVLHMALQATQHPAVRAGMPLTSPIQPDLLSQSLVFQLYCGSLEKDTDPQKM